MSEAPFHQEVEEVVEDFNQKHNYLEAEISGSYHNEDRNSQGMSIKTPHDGLHTLLKKLRREGFLPTQINKEDTGIEFFINHNDNLEVNN